MTNGNNMTHETCPQAFPQCGLHHEARILFLLVLFLFSCLLESRKRFVGTLQFFKKSLLVNDSPDNQVQKNSFINPPFNLIILIKDGNKICEVESWYSSKVVAWKQPLAKM
jgi:hypothetical protein